MRHLFALATLSGAAMTFLCAVLLGPGCSSTPDYSASEGGPLAGAGSESSPSNGVVVT